MCIRDRVRDDEVEGAGQPLRPAALPEHRPAIDAIESGVAGGRPAGLFGQVDAETLRLRQLTEERDQQATGAGPEIEQLQRLLATPGELGKSRLDDRLAIGARFQRCLLYTSRCV